MKLIFQQIKKYSSAIEENQIEKVALSKLSTHFNPFATRGPYY